MPSKIKSNAQTATDDWLQKRWRPVAAFLYIAICACDFIIFPVAWTIIHTAMHTGNYTQWQPLTLQGGGMVHLAFGAILGFYSWGRTREKLAAMSYSEDNQIEDIPVVRPMR